jgi:WhiB family transcriptional regulator, redox-sensing transcriptional regulator
MGAMVATVPVDAPDDVRQGWRAHASCRDTDPDLFFPVGTTGPAVEQIAAAKAVCASCPSRQPCLEFALETNQDSGVWGGLSEDERRTIRRSRARARAERHTA